MINHKGKAMERVDLLWIGIKEVATYDTEGKRVL
jgi:hypothetical protein